MTDGSIRLRVAGLRGALSGPFDLAVAAGECLALTGASGSGKSLFLRMIADLDPNEGEVFLDHVARSSMTAPAWRRRVVYHAAEAGWWHDDVASHFSGGALTFARETAPRLGLSAALLDAAVARLSTGEKQRLALLRSLAPDSPVLLLDEPTGALDPETTAMVEAVLRDRLASRTTIVFVTHNEAQAERLGDRRFRMLDRRLVPA